MATVFDEPSVVQDVDAVGVADPGHAVGDQDDGPVRSGDPSAAVTTQLSAAWSAQRGVVTEDHQMRRRHADLCSARQCIAAEMPGDCAKAVSHLQRMGWAVQELLEVLVEIGCVKAPDSLSTSEGL
ncbi:hypothetical protein ACIBJF_52915 [Streptomyces sp. NPDC050743]|uniref:hypothetical protein n=1 Tax=Streptomyces sp. NPDC050743 TaxID=3365634 RepID=UPI0037A49CD4